MSNKITGINSNLCIRRYRYLAAVWALSAGLGLAALLCYPSATAWAAKGWAWQVLERSIQAGGTVAYEGLRDIVVFRNGQKVAGYQQKVYRAPGNRERVVIVHPPKQRGRLEASDGRTRWEYYPADNRVVVSSVSPLSDLQQSRLGALRASRRQLRAEYLGDSMVAGRGAYIIRINDQRGRPLRQLWIDEQTFVRLKKQRFGPGDQVADSTYFTTIDYRATFATDLFTFKPPANCRLSRVPPPMRRWPLKRAQKEAGFRAILPRHIPGGYRFDRNSVAVTRHKDDYILWLLFSNGLDTFSIFQAPRCLQPAPGACAQGQSWVHGDFCFALVGPLSKEEIQKIKASMGK